MPFPPSANQSQFLARWEIMVKLVPLNSGLLIWLFPVPSIHRMGFEGGHNGNIAASGEL